MMPYTDLEFLQTNNTLDQMLSVQIAGLAQFVADLVASRKHELAQFALRVWFPEGCFLFLIDSSRESRSCR